MTIATEVVPRVEYTGNSAQTVFPFPWVVADAGDLEVYVNAVRMAIVVDYNVSGVGAPTGGNVTFTSAPAIVPVLIVRNVPATQLVSLPPSGPMPSDTLNKEFDKLTMLIQEANEVFQRTLLLAKTSTTKNLTLPEPAVSQILRWKTDLSGLENFDVSTVLPASASLPLGTIYGGSGATTPLGARQAFGLDGQLPHAFINGTGVSIAQYQVVRFDPANDSRVVLGDTVASKAPMVVAAAGSPIANGVSGNFILSGIATVAVTGTVPRGNYIRKSATTLVAEDTGIAAGVATDPPQGSFGVAVTTASGGACVAWLFGFTYPGVTAPLITGGYGIKGLTGANNAGTPNSQFDFAANLATLRDPAGGGTLTSAFATRTLNTATAGPAAGGRDQAGAFSANTWIYAYCIAKTDGTYHVTASLTAPPTGPALPAGYTLWAYLGALRIDNSSNLIPTRLRGPWAWYDTKQNALNAGAAVIETAITMTALIPPNCAGFKVDCRMKVTGGSVATDTANLRVITGGSNVRSLQNAGNVVNGSNDAEFEIQNLAQTLYYIIITSGTAPTLTVDVVGYENPI